MLRIDSGFLILDTEITSATKKKMSGHSFVALAGLDKFNKRGDVLLQLLGYYKKDFDPKYQYRGAMAEKMVKFILNKQNKEYKTYSQEYLKKNGFDVFPQYKYCGGVPDFVLTKEETTIECKSKSMSDFEKVMKEMPLEEVEQGKYYCYLGNTPHLIMTYIFFDEESEKLLFEGKIPNTLDNCKVVFKKVEVDFAEMKLKIGNALSFYNICLENKAIPLDDISPKVLNILKEKGILDTNGL